MWRWIIRVYVSFVVFVFQMFVSGMVSIFVAHLLAKAGFPMLSLWLHAHVLLTMFLLGVLAGQSILGSNFTGRGWFRSKHGPAYEGFKLEEIKPWTWLLVSPIFLLGIVAWIFERNEAGVLPSIAPMNFYQDVLMPNCSLASWKAPQLYPYCGVQLVCVAIWVASWGYSIAPAIRKYGAGCFSQRKP